MTKQPGFKVVSICKVIIIISVKKIIVKVKLQNVVVIMFDYKMTRLDASLEK
jgi:hypothetical protein